MAPIGAGTEGWEEERRVSELGFPPDAGLLDGAGPALPNDSFRARARLDDRELDHWDINPSGY